MADIEEDSGGLLRYYCSCRTMCGGIRRELRRSAWYAHKKYRVPAPPPEMQAGTILGAIFPGQPPPVIAPGATAPTAPITDVDLTDDRTGYGDDVAGDMDIDLEIQPPFIHDRPEEAPPSPQLDSRDEAALDELDYLLERFTSLGPGQMADADPGSADDAAVRRLAQEIDQFQDAYAERTQRERAEELERLDERFDGGDESFDTPNRSRAPSPDSSRANSPPPPDPRAAVPPLRTRFPLSRIPEIALAQEYIELLDNASLDNKKHSPLDPDDLYDLRNPSHDVLDLSDLGLRLGLNIFIALRNTGGSGTYDAVVAGIRAVYPGIPILSYHLVRKCVVGLSGVRTVRFDMCVNSCTAYTGPRLDPSKEENRSCPTCRQPRFDLAEKARTGKDVPRQTFDTVLPGFALQAQFATPDHAEAASYRARAMEKLVPEWDEHGFVDPVGDFVTGSDILEAKIGEHDICVMWSGDGFQLWELKKSDCYVYIWVLLDLPPHLRYKKQYVIPGAVIPGPNKPGCIDSFIFPGLYHIKALQKEGLKIWNAAKQQEYVSQLHVLFVTADTVAAAEVTGLVGHVGKEGCRRYCGYKGRRKPKANQYTYAMYKPLDSNDRGSNGPDWDVWAEPETPEEANARYTRNLEHVCASDNSEDHAKRRLNTGIAKPSLFSTVTTVLAIPSCLPLDLMHWAALNFTALFLDLWLGKFQASAGDDARTWAWVFLVGEVFKKHGREVAEALCYLPGSFERPPRNPAEKLNSGYKAWEFLTWFYGMAPAMLRGVMPEPFYTHFCKAAAAVRILHQRSVSRADLDLAYVLMNQVCEEFEWIYCARKTARMHLVRHAIHIAHHQARDATRFGMGCYLSQYTCERSIGILEALVRQPSNPYKNLSNEAVLLAQLHALYARAPELDPNRDAGKLPHTAIKLHDDYALLHATERTPHEVKPGERAAIARYMATFGVAVHDGWDGAITRWARLRLPNGQVARCAWRETLKELHKLRISRNVKIVRGDSIDFGEVLYYFQLTLRGQERTVVMVHMYDKPDADLLKETFGTYYACKQVPLYADGGLVVVDYSTVDSVVAMIPRDGRWFLVEKISLASGTLAGIPEEIQVEPDYV